jgi:glycosyltransferase involved in cell wall biosynthesis
VFNKVPITVGIPVYNEEKNISNLLISLSKQSICLEKTIIVNDGSTDKTLEKIDEINNKIGERLKIHIINLSENKGLSNALNLIFKEAQSKYLVIMPSDIILPKHDLLEKIICAFDKDDIGMVHCWYEFKISCTFDFIARAYRFSSHILEKTAKIKNGAIWAIGAVWAFPKEIYKKITLPNEIYRVDAFLYLFVLSQNKRIVFLPETRAVIKLPKENLMRFIYRQARTRSIPRKHLEVFGEFAKKEFKEPDVKVLVKSFAECFRQYPLDGICWVMLKTASYIYRKIFKPQPTFKWRTYEIS